ncbi:MAG TPA: hypothetical protein VFV50_11005 [Bdellovibrionales bacterium]|nr:hypothetical protein [Bdellovibrionales bacterium]
MKFDTFDFISFTAETKKPLGVLGVLSVILLFSSMSSTEPRSILLATLTPEDFVAGRALVQVSDCADTYNEIEAIEVEADHGQFKVKQVGVHDGLGTSEHVFFDEALPAHARVPLEKPACVSALEVVGHQPAASATRRAAIKVWGLRL